MSTRDVVYAAIKASFPKFDGVIEPTMTATEVPGWDSTSHVQLMFLLEEQTGKMIDIGHTFGLKTIGDLVAYVDACS